MAILKEICTFIPRRIKSANKISFALTLFLLIAVHPAGAQKKFILGKNYYERSQYDSARACFSSLIDSCKGVCNDSVIALYKIHLGRTLNLQEEYVKALTEFEEAVRLMEQASNENGKAFAKISLAELYRRNGKYGKGAQELDEVLKLIAKGRVNKFNEALCYNRYAAIENERDGYTAKVQAYSKIAIDIADKYGYWEIKAGSLNELGYFEENNNRISTAIDHYKRSLEIEHKLNRPIYIANVVCNLARIHLKAGKYSAAEQYAREGIDIMQRIPISNTKAYLFKILSDALFKQNKFKESREALNEHLTYQTKLLEDYYSRSLVELEAKFGLKKTNDLINLEREKVILARQDADNKKKLILYIAAGTSLLAVLSVLLLLAYRRIRKINVELAGALDKKNVLLKEVNHRVKNNMQTVTSLLEMESEYLKGKREKQVFRNSINRIQTLALAHQNLYNTDNYTSIDLGAYLETLVRYIANEEGCSLKLNLVRDCNIDIEKAQAVGFILNELMANSIKYAWNDNNRKEKIISLEVKETYGEMYFHYADNGKGVVEDEVSVGSIGISLIKSFVKRQLNGTLNVYNESGANTVIKFKKNVSL